MYQVLMDKIREYQKIVIHRHIDPDLDALGAQLGLKGIILSNFNGKEVRVVGEENEFAYFGRMDVICDDFYEGALAIVVDVSSKHRVSDSRFTLAKEIVVIDHHLNESDLGGILISGPTHIATCQMIVEMCMLYDLMVDEDTATNLYAGLVTDSGRFLYPQTSAETFEAAAFLANNGAKMQWFYKKLYTESLDFKKLRGYFISNFQTTSHGVAYMKNAKTLKDQYRVSTFAVSRGMVNQMAGIEGIDMWANFTEDDQGFIQCELRSKNISIVDIAKKYRGGGHALACGCTVGSFEETDAIVEDLDTRIKESRMKDE